MATKLGVLVIHGMGSQDPDFAEEMIEELNDRVKDLGKDPETIAWKPIYWANILKGRQSEYLRNAKRVGDLDYIALSPFERMQKLAGIVTFGCNIPFFTFAYEAVEPIEFPPGELTATLKRKAKWLNYYDPDDVLGYPLKAINADYRKVVTKDIPINVGGVFSSWNPLAHGGYWTDNSFTKPVAKFITSFL